MQATHDIILVRATDVDSYLVVSLRAAVVGRSLLVRVVGVIEVWPISLN
jgi:hypothetical protein